MNERQRAFIMQIVRDQLSDYLADELVNDIAAGIDEGLYSNEDILQKLAGEES